MKPIIFSTPMVRAILDGRKSMTRRVVKPQPESSVEAVFGTLTKSPLHKIKPPYRSGNTLYVRETWCESATIESFLTETNLYAYKADYTDEVPWKWRPSIHMPKEAARLFLRVKDVRVERLQDISNSDAIAEGMGDGKTPCNCHLGEECNYAAAEFAYFWDVLNAKRGYSWENNPWVFVIEFERCEKEG